MSTLTDSPEYKALTDSLDGLAERGLFCALIALFRSLFALLSAIKSGAIVLPPPPVIEPRSGSASVGARLKGVDGRDEHDHDDADWRVRLPSGAAGGRYMRDHDAGRRVRRASEAAAAVARPSAEVAEDLPSHNGPEIRRLAVPECARAVVCWAHEGGLRVRFGGLHSLGLDWGDGPWAGFRETGLGEFRRLAPISLRFRIVPDNFRNPVQKRAKMLQFRHPRGC